MAAQAGLCLAWSETPEDTFSPGVAHINLMYFYFVDNGRVDFPEFYRFMQAEMSKFQDADFMHQEDVIRSAFKTFDKDGNGFIDAKELRYQ